MSHTFSNFVELKKLFRHHRVDRTLTRMVLATLDRQSDKYASECYPLMTADSVELSFGRRTDGSPDIRRGAAAAKDALELAVMTRIGDFVFVSQSALLDQCETGSEQRAAYKERILRGGLIHSSASSIALLGRPADGIDCESMIDFVFDVLCESPLAAVLDAHPRHQELRKALAGMSLRDRDLDDLLRSSLGTRKLLVALDNSFGHGFARYLKNDLVTLFYYHAGFLLNNEPGEARRFEPLIDLVTKVLSIGAPGFEPEGFDPDKGSLDWIGLEH